MISASSIATMRAIIALSLLLLTGFAQAEDLEQFTLADGRVLVGSYDEAAGKLTLVPAKAGKVRVALSVAARDITARKPWVDPVEAARVQAAAEEAKRAKAEAEADQARAASRAVQATIEAQDQRIKDRERQAADKVTRELARERAAYWRERGQEFDALIFSAEEMDEQAAAVQRRKNEAAQREAAEVAWKRKLEEDRARALADERAQAEERKLSTMNRETSQRQREMDERQQWAIESARQNQLAHERIVAMDNDVIASRWITALAIAVIAVTPFIIAVRRRHRYTFPITIICAFAPVVMMVWAVSFAPSTLDVVAERIRNDNRSPPISTELIVRYSAIAVLSVCSLTALVWSVMPGQGQPRPPAPETTAPGSPPGRRRPRAPAPRPAAPAAPAEAPASPNPAP